VVVGGIQFEGPACPRKGWHGEKKIQEGKRRGGSPIAANTTAAKQIKKAPTLKVHGQKKRGTESGPGPRKKTENKGRGWKGKL